ncbi:MAG TPA: MATE family efflux transporter [Vicinamibacterales bacterium]|nr:MATE family efflux transporter [Vicinamibacterales bacterium]
MRPDPAGRLRHTVGRRERRARPLAAIYSADPSVIAAGAALLLVAAAFQVFGGSQVVATGVLRGAGDRRAPMIPAFAGHRLLGLPIGRFLCFRAGWGVFGLWIGLSTGLIFVAATLVVIWRSRHAVSRVIERRRFARPDPAQTR